MMTRTHVKTIAAVVFGVPVVIVWVIAMMMFVKWLFEMAL